MAIKIGKFYITRNNPRELLKTIADKQNIIDKALNLLNSNKYVEKEWKLVNFTKREIELEEILKGDSDEN